jgi:hypothetical protein
MISYVIHGTFLGNLSHILKSSQLETHPKYGRKFLDTDHYNPHQIFTQILFTDLPNEMHQLPHWFGVGIALDKKILKDKKWYATKIGGFLEQFSDAFNSETNKKQLTQEHQDGEILARNAKPNAARIPSLKKLKEHITSRMKAQELGEINFMHSHEVLFDENISLEEYGVAIVFSKWAFNNDKILTPDKRAYITRRCAELSVPLILYGDSKRSNKKDSLGINKFIRLIDSRAS